MALKAVLEKKEDFEALDPIIQAEYKEVSGKWLLDAPDMKPITEFNTVHTALAKERDDHKKTKTALGAFGALKPEEVQVQLARIPELEIKAAGQVDDKKIEEIVNTRIHAKLAPVERERDQLKTQVAEKDTAIREFGVKEKTRTIKDEVGKVVRAAKVLSTAEEDALMLAERVFEVDDTGNVVTKDNVGVTPGIKPDVWLQDMQSKRPHWWAPNQGGGAGNSGKGNSVLNNPFSAEHWNLTEQGIMAKTDLAKAQRYAKAAGVELGATGPLKK